MPAWPPPLYEVPEGAGVVRDAQVTKLVHGDVVEDLERRKHEPPVEGERAARRAGTPEGALITDADPRVANAQPLGLLVDKRGGELPRSGPCLLLAHLEALEREPRRLAAALRLDPPPLLSQQPLDRHRAHRAWNGEARLCATGPL